VDAVCGCDGLGGIVIGSAGGGEGEGINGYGGEGGGSDGDGGDGGKGYGGGGSNTSTFEVVLGVYGNRKHVPTSVS